MQASLSPTAAVLSAVVLLVSCGGDDRGDSAAAEAQDAEVADRDEVEAAVAEPEAPAAGEDADDGGVLDATDDEPVTDDTADWSPASIGSCAELGGFEVQDPDTLTDGLIDTLADQGGAMRADADLGPLTKAVLLLEANEGELPRVRYRLRFGTELRDAPPAADPVPVSFVQIDRFNLGPAIHAELSSSLGEDVVGDLDDFGVGPHVSYCLLMQPLTGMTADVFEAGRAEIPDGAAELLDCLGGPCTTLTSIPEDVVEWQDAGQIGIRIDAVYDALRDGVPSPAGALELALVQAGVAQEDGGIIRWTGFEVREGVDPGQPFVEVLVEVGLGQDDGVDLALREGHVMDHTMEAAWQRISGFPSGIPEDPFVSGAQAYEARAGG